MLSYGLVPRRISHHLLVVYSAQNHRFDKQGGVHPKRVVKLQEHGADPHPPPNRQVHMPVGQLKPLRPFPDILDGHGLMPPEDVVPDAVHGPMPTSYRLCRNCVTSVSSWGRILGCDLPVIPIESAL